MGWVPLCLEKFDYYRTVLRCRQHILCISCVGVSQRRFGHDSVLDDTAENCVVQLLGRPPVHGYTVNHFLLYAYLFPSDTKRDTNDEWGLYPPCYSESDNICDGLRDFRYASYLMSSKSFLLDLQELTISSRQTWILSALDHCQRSFDITWDWSHINLYTNDTSWHLDRLPDYCRRWSWMRDSNGRHTVHVVITLAYWQLLTLLIDISP